MNRTKNLKVEDLPLVDWDEGALQSGGGEPDEAFFIELLGCFYDEGVPHLHNILSAVMAYRRGETEIATTGGRTSTIENRIRQESHAVKGSAANLSLWKIAKAAEDCELPIKNMPSSASPAERTALLRRYCLVPGGPIVCLLREYRSFAGFLKDHVQSKLSSNPTLREAINQEGLTQIMNASPEAFDAALSDLTSFWEFPGASGLDKGDSAYASALSDAVSPEAVSVSVGSPVQPVPAPHSSDQLQLPLSASESVSREQERPVLPSVRINGGSETLAAAVPAPASVSRNGDNFTTSIPSANPSSSNLTSSRLGDAATASGKDSSTQRTKDIDNQSPTKPSNSCCVIC